jgi:hypothetical protein
MRDQSLGKAAGMAARVIAPVGDEDARNRPRSESSSEPSILRPQWAQTVRKQPQRGFARLRSALRAALAVSQMRGPEAALCEQLVHAIVEHSGLVGEI